MSTKEEQLKQEIEANRQKLKEKVGNSRVAGKGSQRRKHKVISKTQINDDKKLKSIIKKYGVQPLPGVDEVNFFKDDNTIVHFTRPEVHANIQSNTVAVFGNPETKSFQELMPEIIQHIGPKQFSMLQSMLQQKDPKNVQKISEAQNEDDDDVPNLVSGENFEEVSKTQ